jgi:hypothetical protein
MGCHTGPPPGTYGAITGSSSPSPRSRIGSRPVGKKAEGRMASDYLAWALADFSGYLAADELYDGPFCVLSVVDNRRFKRLAYEVLDHDPTQVDIQRFFRRFKAALNARSLTVRGITTDASPLYPGPIAKVFGKVPHQICEFHIIAALTKAVLKAVARMRKALAAQIPKLPRGRPVSKKAKQRARAKHVLQQTVTELFDHRHLFVQHYLTPAERRTLARITCGHKPLCTLRKIMDEVYRLFDRRCRSETALQKLAKLRRRVSRFKTMGKTLQKLFSPNLEKALRSSTISCCPRPLMLWNAATVVTARCRKRFTACVLGKTSATESHLICFAMPKPKGATIQYTRSI